MTLILSFNSERPPTRGAQHSAHGSKSKSVDLVATAGEILDYLFDMLAEVRHLARGAGAARLKVMLDATHQLTIDQYGAWPGQAPPWRFACALLARNGPPSNIALAPCPAPGAHWRPRHCPDRAPCL